MESNNGMHTQGGELAISGLLSLKTLTSGRNQVSYSLIGSIDGITCDIVKQSLVPTHAVSNHSHPTDAAT